MRILNIGNLDTRPEEEIVAFCRRRVEEGKGAFLVPVNPIKVVKARSNPEFQRIIDSADLVFPDAWGMRWAAKLLHGVELPLTPGWQLMFSLAARAAKDGHRVFLLGASDDSLHAAALALKERHPKLILAGCRNGFYRDDEEREVFGQIVEAEPDYVFVAMGEEKQEKVIDRLRKVWPKAVCQGVGGSVDLLAGKQPSPPEWIRRRHLEWLYRFFRQPFRIPRFRALPIFVLLVLRAKFAGEGGR